MSLLHFAFANNRRPLPNLQKEDKATYAIITKQFNAFKQLLA